MPVPAQILAKIHIAKNQLGLDDALYRAILMRCAGVRSARDLDPKGAKSVLAHFKKSGWVATPPKKSGRRPNAAPARRPLIQKIEALLADQGRPWSYAEAIAKRMFGIDQIAWCEPEQLHKIVAALSYDARRKSQP